MEGRLGSCSWSPNGEWIAFGETRVPSKPDTPGSFIVRVWNAHTMIEHRVVSQETGSDSFPGSWYIAGFSPDSRWLAWVAKDRSNPHYYVWNVGPDTDEPPRRVLAVAKPDAVLKDFESLSFDPLSKRTVTTHFHYLELKMDYFMRVWDNDTGELLVEMTGHSDRVSHAAFSPDGRRVLSASWDRSAKVWDAESGLCLFSLEGHQDALTKAIFSTDGCYIATASRDRNVHLWTGEDGMRLATFAEHTMGVTHLVFSPDGRTLASGDDDGIVHIRDISGLVQH